MDGQNDQDNEQAMLVAKTSFKGSKANSTKPIGCTQIP